MKFNNGVPSPGQLVNTWRSQNNGMLSAPLHLDNYVPKLETQRLVLVLKVEAMSEKYAQFEGALGPFFRLIVLETDGTLSYITTPWNFIRCVGEML